MGIQQNGGERSKEEKHHNIQRREEMREGAEGREETYTTVSPGKTLMFAGMKESAPAVVPTATL